MAEKKTFGRGRKRGMSFKPSGGRNRRPDRTSLKARANVETIQTTQDEIYDNRQHRSEIVRAENKAHGLPPDTDLESAKAQRQLTNESTDAVDTVQNESASQDNHNKVEFAPVELPEEPAVSIKEKVQRGAKKFVSKVKGVFRPIRHTHKEVLINAESLETRVAVTVKGQLENLTIERVDDLRMVGSIYKGKIRNLEDGLKAAFVDIGHEKNAFLHYWDIIPSPLDSSYDVVDRGRRKKEKPKITNRDIPKKYPTGTELTVQVTKGPIGTKGPRVTTNVLLPGRYLVLLPNSEQSGVSRKIENREERTRLKTIVRELNIPDGMGVIIRTAGQDQRKAYFVRDLALLLDTWRETTERVKNQKAGTCVFEEPDLIERTVRDFLTEDVERIIIDNAAETERVKKLIGRISKRSLEKVQRYPYSEPIFDRFGVTRQLETAYSRKVMLPSGGYVIIDETEALVAIDVNTGSHRYKGNNKKEKDKTLLQVNLEAAEEVCRQLRLRNIGGLIVLDFIDMKSSRDRREVFNRVRDGLRKDKAKSHVLPISDLGLMEMTRQRQSESVRDSAYGDCEHCSGRGKLKSSLTMSVEIQRRLSEIIKKRDKLNQRREEESDFKIRVNVHPSVLERLRNEDEDIFIDMEKRYLVKISFRSGESLHPEEFEVYDDISNKRLAKVDR
ncbi:MAG: Rne/Rng family ribonuclease [Verrucomicrobiota bacterium]|jgi:ribonuclease G|nr:Rne/Rng family ribonuclease [Verrucomicrobiota bacterium]MDP7051765.1 Rne/Rng family ribonuclease [Verrucomicrobiota bacterium]